MQAKQKIRQIESYFLICCGTGSHRRFFLSSIFLASALLGFSVPSFGAAAACSIDSDRALLQPYLNSDDEILSEKCQLSSNAPHDQMPCQNVQGKTEQLSACVCAYKKLDACAESYLAKKAEGCRQLQATQAGSGDQATNLSAAAAGYTKAAALDNSLAKELRSCVGDAQTVGKNIRNVRSKFVQDQKGIEQALQSATNDSRKKEILGAQRIGGN